MQLYTKIKEFQQELPNLSSMSAIKGCLKEKGLNLTVTIAISGVSSIDWQLQEEKISGILKLALLFKISDCACEDSNVFGSGFAPVFLDTPKEIDETKIFSLLVQAIHGSLRKIRS